MKSTMYISWLGLMLVIGLASSCGGSGKVTSVIIPIASTPANSSSSSTAILTQVARSATQTITPALAPTSSLPLSLTPISTTSMDIVPTLSIEKARARMNDLLANNGGCSLPCLWGITPGATKSQEARFVLAPLISISPSGFTELETNIGNIFVNDGLDDELSLLIDSGYLANEGLINRFHFQARALKRLSEQNGSISIFDSAMFGKRLDFYMLHHVLATNGRPSSVLLNTWSEIPPPRYGQGHFNVILLYPDQGIVVEYTTEMHVVGKNVEGCLANAHVEMDLFPKGNVDTFNKQVALTDWKGRIEYYKPIEEVTSLSIDGFYQKFRQQPGKCLETPANLWPLPEK